MCSISVSGSDQVFGITEKNRAVVSRDDVSGELFLLVLIVQFNLDRICDKAAKLLKDLNLAAINCIVRFYCAGRVFFLRCPLKSSIKRTFKGYAYFRKQFIKI